MTTKKRGDGNTEAVEAEPVEVGPVTVEPVRPAPPPAEPAPPEPSLFGRWFDLIFSPEKTFASIDRRPAILWVLLFLVVFAGAFNFFFLRTELMDDLLYEQFMDNPQASKLTDEQIDKALWFSKNVGPVAPVITVPIFLLMGAVPTYVISVILFSGETSFRKIFSLFAHVMLIMPLQVTFGAALVYSSESLKVGANLLLFFPDLPKTSFFRSFLPWFDFFTLWQVILLGLGLAHLCRWRSGRVVTFLLFLYVAMAAAFAGLGSWFTGMMGA